MTVENLIKFLSNVEDKKQKVIVSDGDFNWTEVVQVLEVKTSSDTNSIPAAVHIMAYD